MRYDLPVPSIERLESRLCFAIQNGGFEAFPDFAGYQTIGNNSIRGGNFYVPVPEGEVQGVLSNAAGPTGGAAPVSAAAIETFLGLSAGLLGTVGAAPAVEGSAIKQTFSGNAGDVVSFQYNLLTVEPTDGPQDFAFVTLLAGPPSHATVARLARVSETRQIGSQNFSSGFTRETGYRTHTFTLPQDGTYTLGFGVVDVDDATGNSALLLDAAAQSPPGPRVTSAVFQFAAPHTLRFEFSRDVSPSLAREDLQLDNLTTGSRVESSAMLLQQHPGNAATFTFPGLPGGFLPNGNYRATLLATAVTDSAGTPLAQDHVIEFFVLNGDINRDRKVDSADFVTLASNFGKTGMTYAQGDLNGNGRVDSGDFVLLAANFGRTVPAPPAAAPAVQTTLQKNAHFLKVPTAATAVTLRRYQTRAVAKTDSSILGRRSARISFGNG